MVVDQFEELFTLSPPETQASFSQLLGRLVLDADVHVLLSMRDDFLVPCQRLEALTPSRTRRWTQLGPMSSPSG